MSDTKELILDATMKDLPLMVEILDGYNPILTPVQSLKIGLQIVLNLKGQMDCITEKYGCDTCDLKSSEEAAWHSRVNNLFTFMSRINSEVTIAIFQAAMRYRLILSPENQKFIKEYCRPFTEINLT